MKNLKKNLKEKRTTLIGIALVVGGFFTGFRTNDWNGALVAIGFGLPFLGLSYKNGDVKSKE